MKKTVQKYWQVTFVIVILLIIGAIYETKQYREAGTPTENTQTETNKATNSPVSTQEQKTTFWEGTLKVSDNSSKGNIMLVTSERNIYMHTSRDFSSLYGKEVKVTYDGTLKGFTLKDIVAK